VFLRSTFTFRFVPIEICELS